MSDARAILTKKRAGGRLTFEEARAFLNGCLSGAIPERFATALLMAIYLQGMERAELCHWTRAMLESGERLTSAGCDRPRVDKHSTGGVGDKVSIPLAPALASCGVCVPMISGRGLGHTGGTLDKLESIPGFSTVLTLERLEELLRCHGAVFTAQGERLVPADRLLYALRNETGLIESIPLIASSILSKKLAEGLDALVLDVKFGSGAFLVEPERGRALAAALLDVADQFGLRATVFQTAMDRPLGRACGNALEIGEAIECLRGGGPKELRELVCLFGGELLRSVGTVSDRFAGAIRIRTALDDGSAFQAFEGLLRAQGGDPRVLYDTSLLPHTAEVEVVGAKRAGFVRWRDVRALGWAIVELGGGRARKEDPIDPAVGVVLAVEPGAPVVAGQPLAWIHHRRQRGLDRARAALAQAVELVDDARAAQPAPLVVGSLVRQEPRAAPPN